jgi:preprotein translocase subunit SecD
MIESLRWRIAIIMAVLALSVFFLYPSVGPVPDFWQERLPANPIRLGLDLKGGLHLILEVQSKEAIEATVDNAMEEASTLMKENKIRYTDIRRVSPTKFEIELRDPDQETMVDTSVVDRLGAFRKLPSRTGGAGLVVTLEMRPELVQDIKQKAVRQAVDTIRNRVDQFGVAEPDVIIHGEDRIIVQLPGLKEDVNRAISIIKKTARLEFKLVSEKGDLDTALKGNPPPGTEVLYEIERDPTTGSVRRVPFLLEKRTLMTGENITRARVESDRGQLFISLVFDSRGARQFERITGDHVGERLAIVLDDRVFSAPVIRDRIAGGRAVIEGQFSPQEASDLALVLRAGSLPAPVKILENRTVGPSLGEDSIRLGRNAVLLGLFLVVICMAIYYRWAGVIADIALILNLMLIFAVMVLPVLRATLTLPGLAGVALTMGMAIDANILIFERIREELRQGKSPRAALDSGYAKAFSTIFDANLTTILAALPLIQFGTGPIKGFAVTLCIGLIVSMFTALFVTRTIFDWAFQNMRIKKLSI